MYMSLVVWNNKKMEKSHHGAKAVHRYHRQHGGTKERTSFVVKQYKHLNRIVQHRFCKQERMKVVANKRSPKHEAIIVVGIEKRRMAYNTSSTKDAARRWKDGTTRVD